MSGDLKAVFNAMVSGVVIVTTSTAGKPLGMTASWMTKISGNPMMIAVSLSHWSYTGERLKEKESMGINVLGQGGQAAARHFGSISGRDVDKFEDIYFEYSALGNPVLPKQAIAFLDCKVMQHLPAGDHTLFLAEVVDGGFGEAKEPLAYFRKKFFKLGERWSDPAAANALNKHEGRTSAP